MIEKSTNKKSLNKARLNITKRYLVGSTCTPNS